MDILVRRSRMISRHAVPLLLLLGLATRPSTLPAQVARDTSATTQAGAAGLAWLALVDAGDLEASWDSAAPALQEAIGRNDWVTAVARARSPFEPFGQRTLIGATYRATLPNAPPGPYVVLQYRTAVDGDRAVIETVVPMRLPAGSWLVSGYFVRPAS